MGLYSKREQQGEKEGGGTNKVRMSGGGGVV